MAVVPPAGSNIRRALPLKIDQPAYATIAFPIGTVLSIGPILLNEQKNVCLGNVGEDWESSQ